MRHWWLIAILAVIGSGCGAPPQTQATVPPVDTLTPGIVVETTPAPARSPTPRLAIQPQPAPQAGQVQVSGTGFAGGERIVISVAKTTGGDASSGLVPLASTGANSDGAFGPLTLTLPDDLQSGGHALEAVGQSSALQTTGTLWIRAPQPWLVLDRYDVPQYGDLGLIAGGFEPMDQVQVSLEPAAGARGAPADLIVVTTDQAGNGVWTQVKLPRLAAGAYNFVLRGLANAAEIRREIHVTPLKPMVELSPWAGPPGVPVQVNVRGFAPGERVQISVSGASDSTPTMAQADEYGNLWGAGPVRIPQNALTGALAVNLVGDDSGATASAQFKVLEPKPWLELTSYSGAPGGPVGFGGGGWIGGERVTIHIGSATNPTLASGVADDNGWLKGAAQVYIPLDANDDVIFVALGEQSHMISAATYSVVFPFGLHPKATPTKTGG